MICACKLVRENSEEKLRRKTWCLLYTVFLKGRCQYILMIISSLLSRQTVVNFSLVDNYIHECVFLQQTTVVKANTVVNFNLVDNYIH